MRVARRHPVAEREGERAGGGGVAGPAVSRASGRPSPRGLKTITRMALVQSAIPTYQFTHSLLLPVPNAPTHYSQVDKLGVCVRETERECKCVIERE